MASVEVPLPSYLAYCLLGCAGGGLAGPPGRTRMCSSTRQLPRDLGGQLLRNWQAAAQPGSVAHSVAEQLALSLLYSLTVVLLTFLSLFLLSPTLPSVL